VVLLPRCIPPPQAGSKEGPRSKQSEKSEKSLAGVRRQAEGRLDEVQRKLLNQTYWPKYGQYFQYMVIAKGRYAQYLPRP